VFVTPASSGGGGWAGNAGVIQDIVRFEEPINIEEIPFFEDRIRDHRTFVGRVLFYDKRLSADNSKSCASCHRQKNAFADNKALSDGIYGQKTLRNSMRLANLAFTSAKNRTVAKESSSWTFVRPR
ncbi:MAG: cytochrome c peroxidase, partial [Verrucomicrobiales bacterium]